MKIKKIFLDLDDVCNEFTLQALAEFGCDIKPGEYDKYKPEWGFNILGVAAELHSFWEMDDVDPGEFWGEFDQWFWAGLPESNEFKELLKLSEDIVGFENTLILTAPVCSPDQDSVSDFWCNTTSQCMAGKYDWIVSHLPPEMHTHFSMCPVKRLCVAPDALLIDDSNKNVDEFRAAGGQAILMPRPWNTRHRNPCDRISSMSYVYSEVARILQAPQVITGLTENTFRFPL